MSIIQRFATENYVDEKIVEIEVPVQSVNGKTGEIVLTPDDIGAQAAGDYALVSELGTLAKQNTVSKSDLESDVQESLNKADAALQAETDPTVPAWAKEASKPTYTAEEVGAAEVNHLQSAATITEGTFAGEVIANASYQAPATSLLRNSKLVTSETTPSNNGEICWMYE